MYHLQLQRAAQKPWKTIINSIKTELDRKCNRIFGYLFVNANPSCFQSPFRFDTWYWQNYLTIARLITYFDNFVYSFFVTLVAWFSVKCFPFARQDRQDEMKNKQTITWYFGNFLAKNNQMPSYQNGMKS